MEKAMEREMMEMEGAAELEMQEVTEEVEALSLLVLFLSPVL